MRSYASFSYFIFGLLLGYIMGSAKRVSGGEDDAG
jgi:hypothetical protein